MSHRPRNRHLDGFRVPRRVIHVDACGDDLLEETIEELETAREDLETLREENVIAMCVAMCVAEFQSNRADLFASILSAMLASAWEQDRGGDVYCRWCASTQDIAHDDGCPVGAAETALAEDRGGDAEVES